jgi:uncharacterized protein YdhG (YjbR/CyaY superfamily)
VETDQIDILAPSVFRDLQQINHTQEPRLSRQLRSDVHKADRLDGVHLDLTFFHAVSSARFDVRAHPDPYAARDFSAANSLAETLGERHDESLHPAGLRFPQVAGGLTRIPYEIIRQSPPGAENSVKRLETGMPGADFKSVSEYIASQPEAVRPILRRVRSAIRQAVPRAEEVISYKIPTYRLHGNPVLHFAAWKQHYSLYPASDPVLVAFKDALAAYQIKARTIRFPLSQPVPVKLIASIAKVRAKEVAKREKSNRAVARKG